MKYSKRKSRGGGPIKGVKGIHTGIPYTTRTKEYYVAYWLQVQKPRRAAKKAARKAAEEAAGIRDLKGV